MKRKATMRAMVMERPHSRLLLKELDIPVPSANQVLLKVIACGVCRTDLHIIDGELTSPKLPLIMGHEIIASVYATGSKAHKFMTGDMVGVSWLGHTCGVCRYCKSGRENLCSEARFTGYNIDGGYAEYTLADEGYCFKLHTDYAKPSSAPMMCAGMIGYRSYKMVPSEARRIGIYGFGAAAGLLTQVMAAQKKEVYALTRNGDVQAQKYAMALGAKWAGGSMDVLPDKMDAAIIFAPAGELIPKALKDVDKGAKVICGGIHMSDIPSFPYGTIWEEKSLCSVANITRRDAKEYLMLAAKIKVKPNITVFELEEANQALDALRAGKISGAAVLIM